MTSVLFVCTGNICRSPMAAAFLERLIADRGLEARVASAGILESGHSPTPEGIRAMSEHGLDVSGHLSCSLEESLTDSPDLILVMAREHARRIADVWPDLWPRAFTLKEFVRLSAKAGPRQAGESFDVYLGRLGAGRRMSQLASMVSGSDDVADPIGKGLDTYRACALEIQEHVGALVEHLWPQNTASGSY